MGTGAESDAIDVDAERTVNGGIDSSCIENADSEGVMARGQARCIDRQVDFRSKLARHWLHKGHPAGALVLIDDLLAEKLTVGIDPDFVEAPANVAEVEREVVQSTLRRRGGEQVARRPDDLRGSRILEVNGDAPEREM